jgi:hypothetical protein
MAVISLTFCITFKAVLNIGNPDVLCKKSDEVVD